MNSDNSNTSLFVCNVDEEGRFGGPERRIVQVAKALQNHDVVTHVIYPKMDSDEFERQLEQYGVASTKLDITRLSTHGRTFLRYILRFPFEVAVMVRFFKKNKFDLIHVNGSYQFKTALASFLSGIPLVWHLNDSRMNLGVYKLFRLMFYRLASGFIVAGERVKQYYLEGLSISGLPIKEIHAPVDTAKFISTLNDEDSVTGEIIVATVSGINPDKGVEYFVKTCAQVISKNNSVRFVFAGAELTSQKSYSSSIQDLISQLEIPSDKLKFVGLVDSVPEFLDAADICLFTSFSEASPTSVWEALSMGKPVVSTDVGSVSQHIVDGESGYVAPVGDVELLSQKILELIEDKAKRDVLGVNARSLAVKNLDIVACARLHSEIYREIIG